MPTYLFLCITLFASLGLPDQRTAPTASADPLETVLNSLGQQWKVHEYFRPEYDWTGTFTREGQTRFYRAAYTNAGTSPTKTAQFRLEAVSFANSVLRLRRTDVAWYIDIPIKPGSRTASGRMSWCTMAGCGIEFAFADAQPVPADPLEAVLSSLGQQWKVHEYYRPEYDWTGTFTREGQTRFYQAAYTNAGTSPTKTAQFRLEAVSFANSVLRLRRTDVSWYIDLPVKQGARTASGRMSWCTMAGCGIEFEFGGTYSTGSGDTSGWRKMCLPTVSVIYPNQKTVSYTNVLDIDFRLSPSGSRELEIVCIAPERRVTFALADVASLRFECAPCSDSGPVK